MKHFLVFLICLSAVLSAYTQNNATELDKAYAQLERRGEVYFTFEAGNPETIRSLSRIISIDNVRNMTVLAYANAKEFERFLQYSVDFHVLTPVSELFPVEMSDNPRQVLDWNYYPTYTDYESIMSQFASDHPDICKLITISTLASGRKLLALKITDNPNISEAEPEFLYTSSIHGDETTGYVLMLHLIDHLTSNYGTDPRITDMINGMEIYINPLANPDGTYKGGNSSVNGATRGNANNIDLNRNYPDPEDGPHPDGNPWQPETVAFMNFAAFHHLTMSANFHGGEEVINYPWDTWPRLAADDDWWVYVSRGYADTVHKYAPASYMNEFENGITNGYAWYTISGGRQDYMNYFRNCREVTAEISDVKLLPANQLINHWNYNYRSLLNYLEQCTFGLHGIITDSLTGEPLNARIFISGHDMDSSHVFTDPAVGDYHRLLKAGTYNVTYSANGYYPKTYQVVINDHQKTMQDVQLYDGSLASEFTSDQTIVPTGTAIQFVDQSVGNPDSWRWYFEGGNPSLSLEQNPLVLYESNGTFAVKLVITRPGSVDSVLKEEYITVMDGYLMNNQTLTVCNALFLDSGGIQASYPDNEHLVMTFLPEGNNNILKASFLSFDIETSTNCSNDWLKVYDGSATSAPILGTYCGTNHPGMLMASNSEGALTFEFQSNSGISGPGWNILLECDSNVGIENNPGKPFLVYPNPVDTYLSISAPKPLQMLEIISLSGKPVLKTMPLKSDYSLPINLSSGMYLLKIQLENKTYLEKFIVLRKAN